MLGQSFHLFFVDSLILHFRIELFEPFVLFWHFIDNIDKSSMDQPFNILLNIVDFHMIIFLIRFLSGFIYAICCGSCINARISLCMHYPRVWTPSSANIHHSLYVFLCFRWPVLCPYQLVCYWPTCIEVSSGILGVRYRGFVTGCWTGQSYSDKSNSVSVCQDWRECWRPLCRWCSF